MDPERKVNEVLLICPLRDWTGCRLCPLLLVSTDSAALGRFRWTRFTHLISFLTLEGRGSAWFFLMKVKWEKVFFFFFSEKRLCVNCLHRWCLERTRSIWQSRAKTNSITFRHLIVHSSTFHCSALYDDAWWPLPSKLSTSSNLFSSVEQMWSNLSSQVINCSHQTDETGSSETTVHGSSLEVWRYHTVCLVLSISVI